jgi:RNA polymerase sigma factor (sigma-70 family)
MIREQEDESLIQNILNGNRQAEEMFFNKYQRIVNDFIRNKFSSFRMSGDDIEDCVQIVMIKVFEKLSTYNSEKSSVKTWVLTVAKHVMIDKNRANSITMTSLSTSTLFLAVNNSGSLSWVDGGITTTNNTNCLAFTSSGSYTSCNADFENCSSVNYITSQLSPAEFTLLNMKYVQGYDYDEIGKEFNVTSSTISNKVNYIKTKIKKQNADLIED